MLSSKQSSFMNPTVNLDSSGRGYTYSQTDQEVLRRKDVVPYVASNKAGIPVTRLRVIITLRDSLPAFNIQRVILGKTPHLASGIGGLGNARVPIQISGTKEFVSLPSQGVRGNGGVLFLPPAGSNTITVYTWNTERLSLSRYFSNQSHAEVQFLKWFREHALLFPTFARRIKRMQLYLNNSPCAWCTQDLCLFVMRYNLQGKVSLTWSRSYNKGTSSAENRKKLERCGIEVLAPSQQELHFEMKPQLRKLKVEKQQAHTYLLDRRVHSKSFQAVNRRLERLLQGPYGKPASLLSRVFASPHNRMRIKQLFQNAIDKGNYKERNGGGYEVTLSFKQSTGWSYGKKVHRLKAIINQTGDWHFFPVP